MFKCSWKTVGLQFTQSYQPHENRVQLPSYRLQVITSIENSVTNGIMKVLSITMIMEIMRMTVKMMVVMILY